MNGIYKVPQHVQWLVGKVAESLGGFLSGILMNSGGFKGLE